MTPSPLIIFGAVCIVLTIILNIIWRPKKKKELILLQQILDKEVEIKVLERQVNENNRLISEASDALLKINCAYKELHTQYQILFAQHSSLLQTQPN